LPGPSPWTSWAMSWTHTKSSRSTPSRLRVTLDAYQRAFFGVVIDRAVGAAVLEQIALLAEISLGRVDLIEDQPADFGAQRIVVAIMVSKLFAQPDLGEPGAVKGCSVEISGAVVPGGVDRGGCFVVRDVAEHIAQWGRTEAQGPIQQVLADSRV